MENSDIIDFDDAKIAATPSYGDVMKGLSAISRLKVSAGWAGFPQCQPRSSFKDSTYQPIKGWGIIQVKKTIHSENNGRCGTHVLAGGANFISESDMSVAYSTARQVAMAQGNQSAAAKMSEQYSRHESHRRVFSTSNNTLRAEVWAGAHGDCTNQKRGWMDISVFVDLFYVGEPGVGGLLQSLLEQYDLVDQPSFISEEWLSSPPLEAPSSHFSAIDVGVDWVEIVKT